MLCAQALKSQAKRFGSVVARVDAGSVCGIRRNWNTPLPTELEDSLRHACASLNTQMKAAKVGSDVMRQNWQKTLPCRYYNIKKTFRFADSGELLVIMAKSMISKVRPDSRFQRKYHTTMLPSSTWQAPYCQLWSTIPIRVVRRGYLVDYYHYSSKEYFKEEEKEGRHIE